MKVINICDNESMTTSEAVCWRSSFPSVLCCCVLALISIHVERIVLSQVVRGDERRSDDVCYYRTIIFARLLVVFDKKPES